MTSKKKPASQKKPAPRKKKSSTKSNTGVVISARLKRFLKAFSASAVTVFGIASCALNPQWRDELSLEPIFSQLGWPRQEQSVPPVVAAQGQVQTSFAQCPQFFPNRQAPVVPAGPSLRELCFSSFAILHSGQAKTPVFVAERLNRRSLEQAQGVQRTDKFYADARLPKAERAELGDYRGSGYSRGHMAPAANMATPDAMAQSFSLANMVPQDQRHNGGAWSSIEQDTRKYAMRATGDVYVFTGPVYASRPKTIGAGQVAVPSQIFKVVYDASTGRSWVHWQANHPDTKAGPPISYDEFVQRTGLHLLPLARR